MIKAVIIDDEEISLQALGQKIKQNCPDVQVVGLFRKPEEAVLKINTLEPDVLFLDIEMPKLNGFTLLEKLKPITFEVIFTTAYSEYAIEAIRVSALDFLTKPIENKELVASVERLKKRLLDKNHSAKNIEQQLQVLFEYQHSKTPNGKIAIPILNGLEMVNTADIIKIKGENVYSVFYLADGKKITASLTLKKVESLLGNTDFFRVHKSYIINLKYLVRFTAGVTNEGNTPVYQWKKNGVNVGTNNPFYTDNSLVNGDIISCVLTSSAGCVSANNVSSNTVTMNVIPALTSSLTIAASASTICTDSIATFAATSVNAGAAATYLWKINGVATGMNSPYFFSNQLHNNDIITCELTPGYSCATPAPAISNPVTMTVTPAPVVTLDQASTLCTGNTRTLDAGVFSSYLWSDGSTSSTLTVNSTGTWWVIVTDNNGCKGSDTTSITTLLPLPANFLPADTSFCDYDKLLLQPYSTYQHYTWSNGSTSSSITISQPGTYSLEVTDNNNCVGSSTAIVSLKECLKGLYVPTAFTPNHDGKNDLFKVTLAGNVKQFQFQVFNRWGNIVFQSSNPLSGWDGTFQGVEQGTGVFVWVCKYQLDGEPVKTATGHVTLIK